MVLTVFLVAAVCVVDGGEWWMGFGFERAALGIIWKEMRKRKSCLL